MLLDVLLEPFSFAYMRNAMFAASIVGGICALLSVFLLLKRWSLIGDALSHAVVPGVASAYALGLPYSVGAFFTGFLSSAAILALNQVDKFKQDAVIGLVFSSFFAAGLLLISLNPTAINISAIVYGNILSISSADLWQISAISLLTLCLLILKWRDFELLFFDETQAQTAGLGINRLKIIFFALLSAAIVASLQTVGAILVISLLITPGATAYFLSERLHRILLLASILGMSTCFFGAYLSYFFNTPTGALIVLLQSSLFALTFCFAPKYGLIAQRKR